MDQALSAMAIIRDYIENGIQAEIILPEQVSSELPVHFQRKTDNSFELPAFRLFGDAQFPTRAVL